MSHLNRDRGLTSDAYPAFVGGRYDGDRPSFVDTMRARVAAGHFDREDVIDSPAALDRLLVDLNAKAGVPLVEGGQGRDVADINGDAAGLMVVLGVVGFFAVAALAAWLFA